MTAIKKDETAHERDRPEKWALDALSLTSLLSALADDPEVASRKYAQLRERLNRFFEWNGVEQADELADQALDRLARRIANTASTEEVINNPTQFVGGIARLLVRENWRKRQRTERTMDLLSRSAPAPSPENSREAEKRAACLDACLKDLTPENRALISRYYTADEASLIESRKRLAMDLGMSLNALRNRALRVRSELEICTRTRMNNRTAR